MSKVIWKMSVATYETYLTLLEQLQRLSPDYDYEQYMDLRESLTMLPGYPKHDLDDVVVPKMNTNVPLIVTNTTIN